VKVLTQDQSKRLSAIREYAAFGSGFKIAMRDLEIRGAGNLLGPEQSGFLMSVGYDLYLRLLEEAVLEEQGKPVTPTTQCVVDIAVSAAIPERYVSAPEQRMDLYRRIARLLTQEEADDITDELIDRYGDPPKAVTTLIQVALTRARAARLGITEISQKEAQLRFTLSQPDLQAMVALCGLEKYRQRMRLGNGEKAQLLLRLKKGDDVVKLTGMVVDDLGQIMGK
jgi:transcription-repair coupling factor (superfamily II helicase)